MVRIAGLVFVCATLLVWPGVFPGAAWAQRPAAPKDKMFSGVVTAVGEHTVTAVRTGTKESVTFSVDAETRFEGPKPQKNSRVTIRYVSVDAGERAVSVIVRAPAKK